MSFNVTGVKVIAEGVEHILTERGQTGFVLFGPYDEYEAGCYHVTFEVRPSRDEQGRPDDLVAVVDVAAAEGRVILATSNVFRHRAIERGGVITLRFELTQRERLEFRVQATGRAGLMIRSERLVEADGDGRSRYCPVLPLGEVPTSSFVSRFFDHIRYVFERGLDIEIGHDHAAATVDGISLIINSDEDFQVLDEVFIKNDYRYRLGQKHVVIDVGMNVGFASLFFASNPFVQTVYAFEPFDQPYTRAMANFTRNPDLAAKIITHRFGLSDHDEDISVNTVEGFTLGMTLKGLDRGDPEAIQVRAAGDVLRPIIDDATSASLPVVLKLDCEGSEFPIFDSLIANRLLGRIDVIMIEWHKEWSPGHNQLNLISPLIENDFIVFDHTIASTQIAGMIYGIRRSINY